MSNKNTLQLEQKVMILEIEMKPQKPGTIYSGAADAEQKLNEQLAQGWRVASVNPMGGSAPMLAAMVVLERNS
ncbi:MAG: hypothetical protein HRU15_02230 [Planctomycetes bacterium]|nr:hypothetical protein [Planctomycetota bacterium]